MKIITNLINQVKQNDKGLKAGTKNITPIRSP